MNTTTESGTFAGTYAVGAVSYGIGVSIGILLLITTVTIAAYCCFKTSPSNNSSNFVRQGARPNEIVLEIGIDDEIIRTYPRFLYSEAQTKGGNLASNSTCCSICLGDYKGSDWLRMLPECNHVFHVKCIDPWLRLHPTCPMCRTSPLTTPLSTPLAEVVPLATRRD